RPASRARRRPPSPRTGARWRRRTWWASPLARGPATRPRPTPTAATWCPRPRPTSRAAASLSVSDPASRLGHGRLGGRRRLLEAVLRELAVQDQLRRDLREDLHQRRDDGGPSGLVAGPEAGAVVAVEVLVEEDVIPEARVVGELVGAAVDGPVAAG